MKLVSGPRGAGSDLLSRDVSGFRLQRAQTQISHQGGARQHTGRLEINYQMVEEQEECIHHWVVVLCSTKNEPENTRVQTLMENPGGA